MDYNWQKLLYHSQIIFPLSSHRSSLGYLGPIWTMHLFSQILENSKPVTMQNSSLKRPTFPCQLYELLADSEEKGFATVVTWLPDGKGFIIREPQEFCETVIKKYFNQSKLSSFTRQVSICIHRVIGEIHTLHIICYASFCFRVRYSCTCTDLKKLPKGHFGIHSLFETIKNLALQ